MIGQRRRCRPLRGKFMTEHLIVSDEEATRVITQDMTRRIDQEGHLFGERMRSKEAVAAFKALFARKKG